MNSGDLDRALTSIKTILVEDLGLKVRPEELADDMSLLEGGLALDSVVIAELITHLERRFAFQFDDQHLSAAHFDNLRALAEVVISQGAQTTQAGYPPGGAPC